MRHVISALVMNEPGVLASVAGMFAARGFNIDSLVVGRTENAELSRMTVVVDGDHNVIEQVQKQLAKLVPVSSVVDLTPTAHIERDLALIVVDVSPQRRGEVLELAQVFRGKVVDVAHDRVMIEISGPEQKIEALVELLEPYGIRHLARTGVIAMPRGHQNDGYMAAMVPGSKQRKRSLDAGPAESLPPS